jgi:hypothetical protein
MSIIGSAGIIGILGATASASGDGSYELSRKDGIIIGAVFGGLVFLIVGGIGLCCWCCGRKERREREAGRVV